MQNFLSLLAPADVRIGLFAMLRLKHFPDDVFFRDNPWQSAGVDGHPVCVVGTGCNGTVTCCLTVTSFQATTIERKFRDPANPMRRQYLAIDHSASTACETAQLTLSNGQRMLKQSYIHLDNFILVETRHLEVWKGNDKFLNHASNDRLALQFTNFLEGRIPRPLCARGGGLSPLDMFPGRFTPQTLGMPDLFSANIGAPTAPVVMNSPSFNHWEGSIPMPVFHPSHPTWPIDRAVAGLALPTWPIDGAATTSAPVHTSAFPSSGPGEATFMRLPTGNRAIRIVAPPAG